MPHSLVKKNKEPIFPFEKGDFRFIYKIDSRHESLIKCNYKNKNFFLKEVPKTEGTLIKLDKLTRISPIGIQKEAIQKYAEALEADILFTNIGQNDKKTPKSYEYLYEIDRFIEDFRYDKEVWIDVGFGSGRHLLHEAKKNPNIKFIGIEIHKPSIEQVLKQISLQNIDNVSIISYDARLLFEFIDSNEVGRIFVHFPVPWDKKPHRRVIRDDFIEESLRILKVGGTLELRTDSDNYYEYSKELFENRSKDHKFEQFIDRDLEISSKYEDRWKKQNKTIYDLTLQNSIKSPPNSHESIPKSFEINDLKEPGKDTIKKEGVFVHFERMYVSNDRKVFKLSFGDPSKCEHQYLELEGKNASFFPNRPIPFDANVKAFKIIKECING